MSAVTVKFGTESAVTVWESDDNSCPVCIPAADGEADLDPIEDAHYNMWHPVWADLVSEWYLSGRWLHPETVFQIDQCLFASGHGSLLVGCLDREDLTAPRRYDPDLAPDLHDIGVIAFPLHPFQALAYRWGGHTPEIAMLLCAGTAPVEAAVHESLETSQLEPGHPVFDPHDAPVDVEIRVNWRGPGR
jgi:hypothetical protein